MGGFEGVEGSSGKVTPATHLPHHPINPPKPNPHLGFLLLVLRQRPRRPPPGLTHKVEQRTAIKAIDQGVRPAMPRDEALLE